MQHIRKRSRECETGRTNNYEGARPLQSYLKYGYAAGADVRSVEKRPVKIRDFSVTLELFSGTLHSTV